MCEWRRPFSLLQVYFVSVLVLFKQRFVLLFILPFFFFFVTTKIRNRKAVVKADGPVEGSKTLHDRVGVIVSVRLVSLCASCVISQALFWIVCFVFYFLVLFSGFVFLFFHARAKKKSLYLGKTTTFSLIKKENKRY